MQPVTVIFANLLVDWENLNPITLHVRVSEARDLNRARLSPTDSDWQLKLNSS